jgi:hypothetical protein
MSNTSTTAGVYETTYMPCVLVTWDRNAKPLHSDVKHVHNSRGVRDHVYALCVSYLGQECHPSPL